MNKLVITKVGFFDDVSKIINPTVSEFLGVMPEVSEEFLTNLRMVLEILQCKPQRMFYQLNFPEKHYPTIMSQFFWTKVHELMEKGVMFEVKTSDLISVGWIPQYKLVEGKQTIGWNERTVLLPDNTTYDIEFGFGQDLNNLWSNIQF